MSYAFPHVKREGDVVLFYAKPIPVEFAVRLCAALDDGLKLASEQTRKRSIREAGITVESYPAVRITFEDETNVFGSPEWCEALVKHLRGLMRSG